MAEYPPYNPNFDTNYGSQWSSTAPPPAYGNAPLPGQPVNTQPTQKPPTNPNLLSSQSMFCVCPHCRYEGQSITTKVTGLANHIGAAGTCLIGCWLGCCLIPYCLDDLKDTEHQCASCKRLIGIKKVIS